MSSVEVKDFTVSDVDVEMLVPLKAFYENSRQPAYLLLLAYSKASAFRNSTPANYGGSALYMVVMQRVG